MLYNDPIESVTWDSVEEFCQRQIPEGTTIYYKSNWPKDLAPTLAAMANTLGGLVIIGVGINGDATLILHFFTTPPCLNQHH